MTPLSPSHDQGAQRVTEGHAEDCDTGQKRDIPWGKKRIAITLLGSPLGVSPLWPGHHNEVIQAEKRHPQIYGMPGWIIKIQRFIQRCQLRR